MLAACLGVFLVERARHSDDAGRTLSFATLVIAVVTIILVNRSWTRSAFAMLWVKNTALRWVLLGVAVFLSLALLVPFARTWFRFSPIDAVEMALALGAGAVCVGWVELLKVVRRRTPGVVSAAAITPA